MHAVLYKAFIIAQTISLYFMSIYISLSPIQPRYHPGGPYYYSSYVGYWIPHRPSGEMSKEEAEKSGYSYYEAYFNDRGLITKLIKHQKDGEPEYQYEYNYKGSKYTGMKSTNLTAISDDECRVLYEKYNNKVYKISADNLIGTLKIIVQPESCLFSYHYIITFRADLPLNPYKDSSNSSYAGYNYTGNLHHPSKKSGDLYDIKPVRQNFMMLPDPLESADSFYMGHIQKANDPPTDTFYWYKDYYTNAKRLKENDAGNKFVTDNIFEIVDNVPFYSQDKKGAIYFNPEEAAEKGTAVKVFNLSISE